MASKYIGKTLKIFLSETARPRALIFGMVHYLVDLYQVCSNYGPGAKSGPVLGITCLTLANRTLVRETTLAVVVDFMPVVICLD